MQNSISVKEAIKFHGHLGPYLILGLLAAELALKKIRCKKYFGLNVKVYGTDKKPRSCLIDGLQLATGATYGKGNIEKKGGRKVRILFHNVRNNKKVLLVLKEEFINILGCLRGHKACEAFAKELYKVDPEKIFKLVAHY